jgi:hypothetical protein
LEKAGASFVSTTQSFNTTTSMGRLTLNMLLSSAQFEREVTGERIRDKIAASKRRGLWMGRPVPLSYDVRDRKLVVNQTEAELVRHIIHRYFELGSVRELTEELARDGHRTKIQQRASGPHRGGCLFQRGTLYHLLSNRIYKGQAWPGEHEPIVPRALWDQIQTMLAVRGPSSAARTQARSPSLLVGLLYDGLDRPMTPSHTKRAGRRYVTRPDQLEGGPAWRVAAHYLKAIVCQQLGGLLSDATRLHELIPTGIDAATLQRLLGRAEIVAALINGGSPGERIDRVQAMGIRVVLGEHGIRISIAPASLLGALGTMLVDVTDAAPIELCSPTVRVRKCHELRLIIPGPQTEPTPVRDEKLVALLAEAQAARTLLFENPTRALSSIASENGRCRTRFGRARHAELSCARYCHRDRGRPAARLAHSGQTPRDATAVCVARSADAPGLRLKPLHSEKCVPETRR